MLDFPSLRALQPSGYSLADVLGNPVHFARVARENSALTKYDVLAYLDEVGEAPAYDVADAFDVPYPTAAMALLRLVRQGLAARDVDPAKGIYRYALSDRGQDRLAYLTDLDNPTDRPGGGPPPGEDRAWTRTTAERRARVVGPQPEGDASMKQKKTHTGTFHCPHCYIEFELFSEESLKCDACGGPLAPGSLDEVWDDEDDDE